MRNYFSYGQFVKGVIDGSSVPVTPRGMLRHAIAVGSPHKGDELRKKLIQACEGLVQQRGYKRTKDKEATGYLYQKLSEACSCGR